jgi:hypothetical protein
MPCSVRSLVVLAALRDAEVRELDRAVEGHEHVRRRDVAMHDARRTPVDAHRVRVRERLADEARDLGGVVRGDGPCAAGALGLRQRTQDERAQIDAAHELHREVERHALVVGHRAEVVDVHRVRVREQRRELRLVAEHARELGIGREVREDPLHHELAGEAVRAFLPREEDLRHPARREPADEPVRSERDSDCHRSEGHRTRSPHPERASGGSSARRARSCVAARHVLGEEHAAHARGEEHEEREHGDRQRRRGEEDARTRDRQRPAPSALSIEPSHAEPGQEHTTASTAPPRSPSPRAPSRRVRARRTTRSSAGPRRRASPRASTAS